MQLTNVGAVTLLEGVVHAVHLLLVADQVLDRGNYALALNTKNGLRTANSLKNRVGTKALPVASAQRLSSKGTNSRT